MRVREKVDDIRVFYIVFSGFKAFSNIIMFLIPHNHNKYLEANHYKVRQNLRVFYVPNLTFSKRRPLFFLLVL